MKTMQLYAFACIGVFLLYWSFASNTGAVDCGDKTMSPGQKCITTHIRGSSYTSETRNYAEQRETNRRERFFVGVVGSIMLFLGAGVIIADARSHRKSEKKKIRRGADYRCNLEIEFLDAIHGVTKHLKYPEGPVVKVAVPSGVDNGDILHLPGRGEAGKEGGKLGDAFIEISVKPHPSFTRRGLDIYVDVSVSRRLATEGGTIEAPTLDGPAKVHVPKGTVSGQLLRLRGNGIICGRSGALGHQFVIVTVRQDPGQPQNPHKNDTVEAEFKSVFFNRTSADRDRIISYWMKAKAVDRTEAMRLAVADWRKDNRGDG